MLFPQHPSSPHRPHWSVYHWRGGSRPGWEDSQVSGRGEGKEEEREEEPRAGSSPSPKQSQDSRPGGERGGSLSLKDPEWQASPHPQVLMQEASGNHPRVSGTSTGKQAASYRTANRAERAPLLPSSAHIPASLQLRVGSCVCARGPSKPPVPP